MVERLANSGSLIKRLGTPDKPKFSLLKENLVFEEPKYTLPESTLFCLFFIVPTHALHYTLQY
jgi:hypothetical protein